MGCTACCGGKRVAIRSLGRGKGNYLPLPFCKPPDCQWVSPDLHQLFLADAHLRRERGQIRRLGRGNCLAPALPPLTCLLLSHHSTPFYPLPCSAPAADSWSSKGTSYPTIRCQVTLASRAPFVTAGKHVPPAMSHKALIMLSLNAGTSATVAEALICDLCIFESQEAPRNLAFIVIGPNRMAG